MNARAAAVIKEESRAGIQRVFKIDARVDKESRQIRPYGGAKVLFRVGSEFSMAWPERLPAMQFEPRAFERQFLARRTVLC